MEGVSHDGWAEIWFDDIQSYIASQESPVAVEVKALTSKAFNGRPLFEPGARGFVIGREREMIGEAWGR